jgi:hypothetical protein
MFNWFNKNKLPANVVPFPGPKPVAPAEPPKAPERDINTYYAIGHTDDNRVSIRVGYTTIAMNSVGVQNFIDQLELYKSQLNKDTDE